jgi:diamine N-acetyltransferase
MIKGHSLQLRALEKADLIFLHRLHNNYKTMNYFFEEPFETLRELEDLYEKYVHNTTERRFVIDEINRKCEIDIIIDEKFQGRGFGKQGFVLGVKYAFDILNLFKIYLVLLRNNIPGLNIYKFAGFKKECRLRKEYFRNGEYVDVERMCLFENQWRKLKAKLNEYVGFESVEIKHRNRPGATVVKVKDTSSSTAPNLVVAESSETVVPRPQPSAL